MSCTPLKSSFMLFYNFMVELFFQIIRLNFIFVKNKLDCIINNCDVPTMLRLNERERE